jgi:Protein of unknown function (DUF1997)
MSLCFTASQSVELIVRDQPVPIQHYLRQPQRLIMALVDPSRVESLSVDCFRLKMRPLKFMMLSIQPVVDIRVWTDAHGTIYLESIYCEIRGIEYINQRFNLQLVGKLSPVTASNVTYLQGKADLGVQVELPPAFQLTPKPLLEATGNGLLRSVLLTIKQRLMHQLMSDYRQWATTQTEVINPNCTPVLASNTPVG